MSHIVPQLVSLLEEDVITRPAPAQITQREWVEKAAWAEDLAAEGEEVKRLLDAHLERMGNSAWGLFLRALTGAALKESISPSFDRFLELFAGQKKPAPALLLAQEVLRYNDYPQALTSLAQLHQQEGHHEELLEIWDRLLKADPSDLALPFRVAQLREKLGQTAEAIRSWRLAFFRALEKREAADLWEAWRALIRLAPEDSSFFLEFGRKIEPLLSKERLHQLFAEPSSWRLKHPDADVNGTLALLQEALRIDPEVNAFRDGLVTALRKKYEGHSLLDNALMLSGLLRNWKSLAAPMEFFEKYIRFDKDKAVHHRHFGYGLIREIQASGRGEAALDQTRLTVDFEGRKSHTMTLRIALASLGPCGSDDLPVLRAFDLEALRAKLADRRWLAEALLKTVGKPAGVSDLKAVLVPRVIDEAAWTALWKEIKAVYDADPAFETRNRVYSISTRSAGFRDELLRQVRLARNPAELAKSLETLVSHFAKVPGTAEALLEALKDELDAGGERSLRAVAFLRASERDTGVKIIKDFDRRIETLAKDAGFAAAFEKLESPVQRSLVLEALPKAAGARAGALLAEIFFGAGVEGKARLMDLLVNAGGDHAAATAKRAAAERGVQPEHYLLVAKYALLHPGALNLETGVVVQHLAELIKASAREVTKAAIWKRVALQASRHLFAEGHLERFAEKADEAARSAVFKTLEESTLPEDWMRTDFRALMTRWAK